MVTAFTIESYRWLQADPNDAVVVLLSQIAHSVSPNYTAAPPIPATAGLPGSVSIRINVYWFMALSLSLSAALVAILCKQWIRVFERNPGLTPEEFVGIHQIKVEGLEKWKVGSIISLLPLILQLALAIFALGVLELLWQLHSAVAAIVCIPTIAAFSFYGATAILPALLSDGKTSYGCPFKSPQAMLAYPVYQFYLWMKTTVESGAYYLGYLLSLTHYYLATGSLTQHNRPRPIFRRRFGRPNLYIPAWYDVSSRIDCWVSRREPPPPPIYRSLRWIQVNLNDGDIKEWIWHCLWERATAPDPGFTCDEGVWHKRGFFFVECGGTAVPLVGLRAIALAYLAQTPAPGPFLLEVYMQHLNQINVPGAEYLTDRLHYLLLRYRLNAKEAVTLLHVASAYARAHVQEPIGKFLVDVARLFTHISDIELRRVLLDGTLLLYHTWLHAQRRPLDRETVTATKAMVWFYCGRLGDDEQCYIAQPERLRRRLDVHMLTELVGTYAQSDEDWEAAPLSEGHTGAIVRALKDMARHGMGLDGAAPSDAASASLLGAHAPAAPTLSAMAQLSTEKGPPSHSGRGSETPAQAPTCCYPAVEDSVGHEASSRGPPDSFTLSVVAIHPPPSKAHPRERAAAFDAAVSDTHSHALGQTPSEDTARPRDHRRDREDVGGMDARASAASGEPDGLPAGRVRSLVGAEVHTAYRQSGGDDAGARLSQAYGRARLRAVDVYTPPDESAGCELGHLTVEGEGGT